MAKHAREAVLEALKTGLLTLQIIPEVLDAPQSVIVNYGRFFPERQLFMEQRGNGKSWFLPNPLGLANKYRKEHDHFKKKATPLNPEE